MNFRALLRAFAWMAVVGFLLDLLRRCWIVEAWTIGPLALLALGFAIRATYRASRQFLASRPAPPSPYAFSRDDTH